MPLLGLMPLPGLLPWPAAASGGDGAPPAPELCVIAPRVEADRTGEARATLPVSRPTIFVREPLERVRILRGPRLLWQRQAGIDGPIQGPIAWPLPPLRPGESLRLQLQPRGSGPDAFATIQLRATGAGALRRNDALVAGLGREPGAWQAAVEGALARGDGALATALLFAFEGPSAAALDALRLTVFQRSCQEAPPP